MGQTAPGLVTDNRDWLVGRAESPRWPTRPTPPNKITQQKPWDDAALLSPRVSVFGPSYWRGRSALAMFASRQRKMPTGQFWQKENGQQGQPGAHVCCTLVTPISSRVQLYTPNRKRYWQPPSTVAYLFGSSGQAARNDPTAMPIVAVQNAVP